MQALLFVSIHTLTSSLPPSPAPSGPNGLLYEDCLYQLLRQDRVLSLCTMFRARFPGKCEAIWAKVSDVNGVMPLADVDRASKVILAELWPEADEEDSGHEGDPEGGQEGEQGVRQLRSAWRLAGRKARRRFLADLAAILRSLDINGSDSLDFSEFRVGLMQHLYTQARGGC